MDELGARQHGPHPLERGAHFRDTTQTDVELTIPLGIIGRGRSDRAAVSPPQMIDESARDLRPLLVVRTPTASRPIDDARRRAAA